MLQQMLQSPHFLYRTELSAVSHRSYLKGGQFVDVKATTNQMLNTILTAAGVRKSGAAPVDDFGDASLSKGVISAIIT